MHSGFAEVNFSAENLKLGKSGEAVGPISEEGLDDVYWYSVAGVARGERHDIYRIRVLPRSTVTPAVAGYYYVEDSTWSVNQVEIELNRGARAVFLPMAQHRITSYNVCYTKLLRFSSHISPRTISGTRLPHCAVVKS